MWRAATNPLVHPARLGIATAGIVPSPTLGKVCSFNDFGSVFIRARPPHVLWSRCGGTCGGPGPRGRAGEMLKLLRSAGVTIQHYHNNIKEASPLLLSARVRTYTRAYIKKKRKQPSSYFREKNHIHIWQALSEIIMISETYGRKRQEFEIQFSISIFFGTRQSKIAECSATNQ